MARVTFSSAIERHIDCPADRVTGRTVREVLARVFLANPNLRGYILDEQGACRQHIVIFVDGDAMRDRANLSDAVSEQADVHVFQALSGG